MVFYLLGRIARIAQNLRHRASAFEVSYKNALYKSTVVVVYLSVCLCLAQG